MEKLGIKLGPCKNFLLNIDDKVYEVDREILTVEVCFPSQPYLGWKWIPIKESLDVSPITALPGSGR
jgi:hypothetical protein